MGGGILQLVAYGAQDIYITGKPEMTFFKYVFKRHTNFAIECITQTFSGSADFGKKLSCTLSRNGDLISRAFLKFKIGALSGGTTFTRWCNGAGYALVSDVTLNIGGQEIDKHYGKWMHIYSQLTTSKGLLDVHNHMVGLDDWSTYLADATDVDGAKTFYVPLHFYFCQSPGLAIPLVALQHHDIKIDVNIANKNRVICNAGSTGTATFTSAELLVDYVYLDKDERRHFAKNSHEYLITQVQRTTKPVSATKTSLNTDLNFNHPVKELIWVIQENSNITESQQYGNQDLKYSAGNRDGNNVSDESTERFTNAKIVMNGTDRFREQDADYFRLVQPYYSNHSNYPLNSFIYLYSFAFDPENHQPSGACNFSRLDSAKLNLTFASSAGDGYLLVDNTVTIYAINYNVLRIRGGLGGLSYSN